MPADYVSLLRGMLPGNPKLTHVMADVLKSSFNVRFLPQPLIRLMINKALEEVRKHGTEIMKEPTFAESLGRHAFTLKGRFQAQISQLNQTGGRK